MPLILILIFCRHDVLVNQVLCDVMTCWLDRQLQKPAWPWRWNNHFPSKGREPQTCRDSVTSQETWILNNNAVRNKISCNACRDLLQFSYVFPHCVEHSAFIQSVYHVRRIELCLSGFMVYVYVSRSVICVLSHVIMFHIFTLIGLQISFKWRCDPTRVMASSFLRFSRSHTTTHHSR
jgi:hypothetical protein